MYAVEFFPQGDRIGSSYRCRRQIIAHAGMSFETDRGFYTRGEVVDLRVQQSQKHSCLRDVGVFVGGRHALYEVTKVESFSFAMRSTSRGTKSRIRCPAK